MITNALSNTNFSERGAIQNEKTKREREREKEIKKREA